MRVVESAVQHRPANKFAGYVTAKSAYADWFIEGDYH